ncbi:hypothetical protein [Salisediminibacterium beveridgei]|uniref:Lipoprotein n=1 Tax=Salisediminibacterium beveridgei TaxID=632773 RepID=A0A1D7QZH2_9BACI|nr:hypothetical protein [Salisediminibacterium beveridgei]AOM84398.1 hypothetical protein BBEV_3081 [Salisediminibacterium beveridgei]
MKRLIWITSSALLLVFVACNGAEESTDQNASSSVEENGEIETNTNEEAENDDADEEINHPLPDEQADTITEKAASVADALEEQDMERVAEYVHPEKGLLIHPQSWDAGDNYAAFTAEETAGLADDDTRYDFGTFSPEGPIEETYTAFAEQFMDDFAFLADARKELTDPGFDALTEAHPDATFVELHDPGNEEDFNRADFQSLWIAFEQLGDKWHLTAIAGETIHDHK